MRPRPLGWDERIPLVWTHQTENNKEPLEPALVDFLTSSEEAAASKLRTSAQALKSINMPGVRPVADYAENCAVLRHQGEAVAPGPSALDALGPRLGATLPEAAAANGYIKCQHLAAQRKIEDSLTDYDLEEPDWQWLKQYNAKAAKRLGPDTAPLSEEQLEGIMAKLERLHWDALQARRDDWMPDVSAGRVPSLPSTEAVLPRAAAVAGLTPQHPEAVAAAVYRLWLQRRRQMPAGGPLLQHLWFEQPWQAIAFPDETNPERQGDMPFVEAVPRSGVAGSRMQLSAKESREALSDLRAEFELLRTLADQMRKRERLKRQALRQWIQLHQQALLIKAQPPCWPAHDDGHRRGAKAGKSAASAAKRRMKAPAPTRRDGARVPGAAPGPHSSALLHQQQQQQQRRPTQGSSNLRNESSSAPSSQKSSRPLLAGAARRASTAATAAPATVASAPQSLVWHKKRRQLRSGASAGRGAAAKQQEATGQRRVHFDDAPPLLAPSPSRPLPSKRAPSGTTRLSPRLQHLQPRRGGMKHTSAASASNAGPLGNKGQVDPPQPQPRRSVAQAKKPEAGKPVHSSTDAADGVSQGSHGRQAGGTGGSTGGGVAVQPARRGRPRRSPVGAPGASQSTPTAVAEHSASLRRRPSPVARAATEGGAHNASATLAERNPSPRRRPSPLAVAGAGRRGPHSPSGRLAARALGTMHRRHLPLPRRLRRLPELTVQTCSLKRGKAGGPAARRPGAAAAHTSGSAGAGQPASPTAGLDAPAAAARRTKTKRPSAKSAPRKGQELHRKPPAAALKRILPQHSSLVPPAVPPAPPPQPSTVPLTAPPPQPSTVPPSAPPHRSTRSSDALAELPVNAMPAAAAWWQVPLGRFKALCGVKRSGDDDSDTAAASGATTTAVSGRGPPPKRPCLGRALTAGRLLEGPLDGGNAAAASLHHLALPRRAQYSTSAQRTRTSGLECPSSSVPPASLLSLCLAVTGGTPCGATAGRSPRRPTTRRTGASSTRQGRLLPAEGVQQTSRRYRHRFSDEETRVGRRVDGGIVPVLTPPLLRCIAGGKAS